MKNKTVFQRWAAIKTNALQEWNRVHDCMAEASQIIKEKTGQEAKYFTLPVKLDCAKLHGDVGVTFHLVAGESESWLGSKPEGRGWFTNKENDLSLTGHFPSKLKDMEAAMAELATMTTGHFVAQWEASQV